MDGLANFVPRVAWEMYGMANSFNLQYQEKQHYYNN